MSLMIFVPEYQDDRLSVHMTLRSEVCDMIESNTEESNRSELRIHWKVDGNIIFVDFDLELDFSSSME